MSVAVATAPNKRRKSGVPAYLIYETLNGRALYYRGYRDVTTGKKTPAEIMGSSSLQATLVMFLGRVINRKRYLVVTNESGIHLDKGNNLSNDIAIFDKAPGLTLTDKYFTVPHELRLKWMYALNLKRFLAKNRAMCMRRPSSCLNSVLKP